VRIRTGCLDPEDLRVYHEAAVPCEKSSTSFSTTFKVREAKANSAGGAFVVEEVLKEIDDFIGKPVFATIFWRTSFNTRAQL